MGTEEHKNKENEEDVIGGQSGNENPPDQVQNETEQPLTEEEAWHQAENTYTPEQETGVTQDAVYQTEPSSPSSAHTPSEESTGSDNDKKADQFQAYVDQGKKIGKNYFSFFVQAIQAPTKASVRHHESFSNAIVSLALITLLIPTIMYLQFRPLLQLASMFGGGPSPAGTLFFRPLLYIALLVTVIVFIIFGITKLMKVQYSLQQIVARFGALLIAPIGILIVSLLLSVMQLGWGVPVAGLGILLIFFSAAFTIYSFRHPNEEGLDPYFGIILLLVGIGLFSRIVMSGTFNLFTNFL
ncbi:Yip1 family protein [Bacillus horti]|uniref:YIP1 family protein n=1 Tax=Caldalkalibacillus horti TaxID=77523 RepID=A0ABT9W2F1_9BACI|nr:Yip1 family protein [Bacillus horti]MDQ0167239.1 hypothetical protein [Bacillus horti]